MNASRRAAAEVGAWLGSIAETIAPLDADAMAAARARLDRLTKPPGSLGRLELLVAQLAGITGSALPRVGRPAVVVFAGDHGVTVHGVSAYPAAVTAQMVRNFVDGGAAICVLAEAAGASLTVVDVGVGGPTASGAAGSARLVEARIRAGTRDMTVEPAMTPDETRAAIGVGRDVVRDLVEGGADTIALGEMGIGNTTAASALAVALTGRPAAEVTGRGTGLGSDDVARKIGVVESAVALHRFGPAEPLEALAAVGGLEVAALVGAILAGVEAHVPVVLDGFITGAGALVAAAIAPAVIPRLVASHRSAEPGHAVVLRHLGLEPLLELDLRLGEGSGAALALPLIRTSTLLPAGMATFESAGVSEPPVASASRREPAPRSARPRPR